MNVEEVAYPNFQGKLNIDKGHTIILEDSKIFKEGLKLLQNLTEYSGVF